MAEAASADPGRIRGWDALADHIRANPITGDAGAMRRAFDRLAPHSTGGMTGEWGGVTCHRFGAGDASPILWLHGGGLVFGSARSHGAMAQRVAEMAARPVVMPQYRLAPEHPWPAPLHDVLAVLDAWPGAIDMAGDSAGGHLALLAALRRPGRVRRLALISPNTDRTGRSLTRGPNTQHDLMNADDDDRALAEMSFGAYPQRHPDASPVGQPLRDLPPVWITAATNEVLLDDTLLLARAMGRQGVPHEMHILKGLCHLWPLWPDALDASHATLRNLARFVNR